MLGPWAPPVEPGGGAQDVMMKFTAAQMLPGVVAHRSYQKDAEGSVLKMLALKVHACAHKHF